MSDTRNIIDINTAEHVGTIEMTAAQFAEYAADCGDTGATTPLALLAYGENLQLVSAKHTTATVYVEA
jgi:secreted protein with Ig-like and vWFA domain